MLHVAMNGLLRSPAAAWQHLAAALVQAAALVVDQQQRLNELQRRRQELLPRSLHEARQQLQRRQRGEGSSRERERWEQLQELAAAAVEAQGQLRLALQAYEQCCTALRVRREAARAGGLALVPGGALSTVLQEPAALSHYVPTGLHSCRAGCGGETLTCCRSPQTQWRRR